MKALENIWKQLSEVNLSSEKVELNVARYMTQYVQAAKRIINNVDIILKEEKEAESKWVDAEVAYEEAEEELKEVRTELADLARDGKSIINELDSTTNKINKAAKELGMSSVEISREYPEAVKLLSELKTAVNKLV